MAMWNPWRGCKKCSDGCLHCYIHKGDAKRNVNTNDIKKARTKNEKINVYIDECNTHRNDWMRTSDRRCFGNVKYSRTHDQ